MKFDWKFRNANINYEDWERHFICQNTRAKKRLTYTTNMKFKKASFALHNSDKYNINTEDDLAKAISK